MTEETSVLEGPGQFTGLRIEQPKPGDFMFGGETGILNTSRNPSGDWRSGEPTPKGQLMKTTSGGNIGDTEACTDFSGTNSIAVQLDWLISQGQIDPNGLNFLKSNGYIDASGKVNLSPRFTAVMSGTTPQNGNSLPAVWQSMHRDGVVPESAWPMPQFNDGEATQYGWSAYYATIDPAVIALGKQFLQWFQIQYEWIAWEGAEKTMSQLAAAMPVAPMQIATAVCAGWNTEVPIKACGDGSQHATTLLNVEVGTAYDILDHYGPFMKQFAPDYSISYAMRGVIASVPQNPAPTSPFTYMYTVNLTAGAPTSALVTALQQGLQTLKSKSGAFYMKPGVFGPFGPQTILALAQFQLDHGITDAPQGHDFGPQSRSALTAALIANAQQASGEPLPRPLNPDAHRPN